MSLEEAITVEDFLGEFSLRLSDAVTLSLLHIPIAARGHSYTGELERLEERSLYYGELFAECELLGEMLELIEEQAEILRGMHRRALAEARATHSKLKAEQVYTEDRHRLAQLAELFRLWPANAVAEADR